MTNWTLIPDEEFAAASTNMRTRTTRFPIGSDDLSRAAREHELEHIRTSVWPKPTESATWDYVDEYRVDTKIRQIDKRLKRAIDKLRRDDIDAWIQGGGLKQTVRTRALAAMLGRGYRLQTLVSREHQGLVLNLMRSCRRQSTAEVVLLVEAFDKVLKTREKASVPYDNPDDNHHADAD